MLFLTNNGTPLPPAIPRVSVTALYIKEAIGFALWNGERGDAAELYLIRMPREGHPDGVIRFLGGTAVPPPFSTVSPFVQSLMRLQDYFGETTFVTQECAAEYIPLHIFLSGATQLYANPNGLGSAAVSQQAQAEGGTASHVAPNVEIHGLLPTSAEFLEEFRPKLERIRLVNGKVVADSGLGFNNAGIIEILRHMLTQVQDEDAPFRPVTEVNAAWDNGNYTVAYDI